MAVNILNGEEEYYDVVYSQDEIFFVIGNFLFSILHIFSSSLISHFFVFQDVGLQVVVQNAIQGILVFGAQLETILGGVCQRKDLNHAVESW